MPQDLKVEILMHLKVTSYQSVINKEGQEENEKQLLDLWASN